MTEEASELMRGIGAVVRAAKRSTRVHVLDENKWAPSLHVHGGGYAPLPELTPEQEFALKVLVGDPSALPDALADYMIDQGHEYAEAVAEKARQEERERCLAFLRHYLDKPSPVTSHDLRSAYHFIAAGITTNSIPHFQAVG